MDRKDFQDKYLTDAFFFVENRKQFETLQKIGIEFGLTNHTGNAELIEYDMHNVSIDLAPMPNVKVAKNLTFFPQGYFQQSCFWVRGARYGEPKDFKEFITDYNKLSND